MKEQLFTDTPQGADTSTCKQPLDNIPNERLVPFVKKHKKWVIIGVIMMTALLLGFIVAFAVMCGVYSSASRKIRSLQDQLYYTQSDLQRTQNELYQTKNELFQTKNELSRTQQDLRNAQWSLQNAQWELSQTRKLLADTEQRLRMTRNELSVVQKNLNGMMCSHGFYTGLDPATGNITSVVQALDGDYIVAYRRDYSVDIARISPKGAQLWQLPLEYKSQVERVTEYKTGGIIATLSGPANSTVIVLSSVGKNVWKYRANCYISGSLQTDESETLLVCADTDNAVLNLIKLNSTGDEIFTKTIEDFVTSPYNAPLTKLGDYYVLGGSYKSTHTFRVTFLYDNLEVYQDLKSDKCKWAEGFAYPSPKNTLLTFSLCEDPSGPYLSLLEYDGAKFVSVLNTTMSSSDVFVHGQNYIVNVGKGKYVVSASVNGRVDFRLYDYEKAMYQGLFRSEPYSTGDYKIVKGNHNKFALLTANLVIMNIWGQNEGAIAIDKDGAGIVADVDEGYVMGIGKELIKVYPWTDKYFVPQISKSGSCV